jgi:histidine ammonia-lyase
MYYIVNQDTTEQDLVFFTMDEVFKFTEKHNLIELNERLKRRIFHCHEAIDEMIYSDQLTYYICTGCGSEDVLREERQREEWELKLNNLNPSSPCD